MKPEVSRYLSRLENAILSAGNGPDRDSLLAERVAYLARRGRMPEAKESLAVLRTHYRAAPRVEVNCWVLFADAMIQHFDELGLDARDRLLRCQGLAAASDLPRMDALASAWLALLDYSSNDFVSMDRQVRRAMKLAGADDHLVLSRATMVVGLAYLFAGKLDLADKWMRSCRAHNSALGDDSMWSSILHNTAWAKLIHLRQKRWIGSASDADYQLTRASIESAVSYDQMTRSGSLQTLNDVLLAQIRSLLEDHTAASELFARVLPNALEHGLAQWLPILNADAAVSELALGGDRAMRLAADAATGISASGHPDDVASAWSRLAEFFLATGDTATARVHSDAATQSWIRHVEKQRQIIALLDCEPIPKEDSL